MSLNITNVCFEVVEKTAFSEVLKGGKLHSVTFDAGNVLQYDIDQFSEYLTQIHEAERASIIDHINLHLNPYSPCVKAEYENIYSWIQTAKFMGIETRLYDMTPELCSRLATREVCNNA